MKCEDFYCFNKPLVAPADGWVEEILDGVDDNVPGEVNLDQNWGNTIVIRHHDKLFTKLSHLKNDSFRVEKGDFVKRGDVLALCGNSGRSPRPHLHFQVQSDPFIGSATLDYPFAFHILKNSKEYELKSFYRPKLNEIVSNIELNDSLRQALQFIPGQKLCFNIIRDHIDQVEHACLTVKTDPYNNTYIEDEDKSAKAWFRSEAGMTYFTHFEGDKNSFLYLLYLGLYRSISGFYTGLKVHDMFTLSMISSRAAMLIQDLIAPFYTFLHAGYKMEYLKMDDELSGSRVELHAQASARAGNRVGRSYEFWFSIENNHIDKIIISTSSGNMEVTWEEALS
jgi:hypothetical protein